MSLQFYDINFDLIDDTNPIISSHNGFGGDSTETMFFLRNSNILRYYENIRVSVTQTAEEDVTGEYGVSGWSFKLIKGSKRPTEKEWDVATNMTYVDIEGLGTTGEGDTSSYIPLWLRVYVPGRTPAKYKNGYNIYCSAIEKVVGS